MKQVKKKDRQPSVKIGKSAALKAELKTLKHLVYVY